MTTHKPVEPWIEAKSREATIKLDDGSIVFCFQTGETAYRVAFPDRSACVVASEAQVANAADIETWVISRAEEIRREGGSAQRL